MAPKFKIGDILKSTRNYSYYISITDIDEHYYHVTTRETSSEVPLSAKFKIKACEEFWELATEMEKVLYA